MEEWRIADILMIVVVCGVIYAILSLVNRSLPKKAKKPDENKTFEASLEPEELSEDN